MSSSWTCYMLSICVRNDGKGVHLTCHSTCTYISYTSRHLTKNLRSARALIKIGFERLNYLVPLEPEPWPISDKISQSSVFRTGILVYSRFRSESLAPVWLQFHCILLCQWMRCNLFQIIDYQLVYRTIFSFLFLIFSSLFLFYSPSHHSETREMAPSGPVPIRGPLILWLIKSFNKFG